MESSLHFLTSIPSLNENFPALLWSFSPSFWCQRKMCLFCTKDTHLSMFWSPEPPSISMDSALFFLFSPLYGQFSSLPSLLTQWFSIGNSFASLPRQCLETCVIITMASTGTQHVEAMDAADHATTHRTFHPYPHHTCTQYSVTWPQTVSKLIDPIASRHICSPFLPSILPSVSFHPSFLFTSLFPSFFFFSSLTHIHT